MIKTKFNSLMSPLQIKITYIDGLREIVLSEISKYPALHLNHKDREELYFDFTPNYKILEDLRGALRVYAVFQDIKFNPFYISNHKSIIGKLIDTVLSGNTDKFSTFKVSCAGSDTKEVRGIIDYIKQTYKLVEDEDADLKIHIIKLNESWEVGVQLTRRPLTVRDYKVENIKGGINPTIAHAMNSLAGLNSATSYLNIFSGSATLLIEAARLKPELKLVGFDINKKTVSLAIQNIKKAGLIKSIQLKVMDIFNKPESGKFDVITSDLPFGMLISKDDDLEKLYQCFVDYCEDTLNSKGKLVVYTNEHETLKRILAQSEFKIIKTLNLKFLTSVNAYLYPKVFVCELKEIL